MKIIRGASENEMILEFLKGEIDSKRFRSDLIGNMEKLGIDEKIIRSGSTDSDEENSLRKKLLGAFRGYPDREIFENYPRDISWKYVRFSEEDLDKLYFVDYSYWNEISKGTSKPSAAAETVRSGIEIFGQSNQYFVDGAEFLEKNSFPPMILLTCGNEKHLILEGHCRAVSYALRPGKFDNTFGYVGFCTADEMKRKEPKMIRKGIS